METIFFENSFAKKWHLWRKKRHEDNLLYQTWQIELEGSGSS